MMRTISDFAAAPATPSKNLGAWPGLRAAIRQIEAIRRRGRRRATLGMLAALDDRTLRDIGLSRDQVLAARAHGRLPIPFNV